MKIREYLIENTRKKIYFAHPRATYGKTVEKKAMDMIMKEFPDYIIVNPNVNWIQGRVEDMGFDIFFKVINTVQILCVLPFEDGKIGNGSWRECQHADKKGIPIYVVNPYKNTLTKTPFNRLKHITPEETFDRIPKGEQNKWKMYEGKI